MIHVKKRGSVLIHRIYLGFDWEDRHMLGMFSVVIHNLVVREILYCLRAIAISCVSTTSTNIISPKNT